MGLVYIEYISRRAGVNLASFHAGATAGQAERELIFSCKGPAPAAEHFATLLAARHLRPTYK